jgi:bifunctional non-homologous end joining protein LigD
VPYGTRARAGAPVSAPLAWEELGPKLRGDSFNVGNIRGRLSRLRADPWASFFKVAQSLPAGIAERKTKRKTK